ncbi:hypothetical protein CEXT_281001 [Caerostris extrusa]|uniref:Uncharacterized protein n=1 Tax=Caerostris extrusa TaxID=172846 RepID=A0AAV4M8S6_CAEEX|nr:hypothetical protein CEXT_281001 [Caerostris extrusa]
MKNSHTAFSTASDTSEEQHDSVQHHEEHIHHSVRSSIHSVRPTPVKNSIRHSVQRPTPVKAYGIQYSVTPVKNINGRSSHQ